MSEEQPLPEKRERLSDQISTFPDTIDLIQPRDPLDTPVMEHLEMAGAGDHAIAIAKLKRELGNEKNRADAAENEINRVVALNQENLAKAEMAWQARAEAIAREADLERLLKDAVRLLGYFVGMR